MKFIVGGVGGEQNTFLTPRLGLKDLWYVERGEDILIKNRGTNTSVGGFIDIAEREGVELIPTVLAHSGAGPKWAKDAYESIKNEILKGIVSAGKIDGVLLDLHGAMVVDGMPDGAEGDFVQAVRDIVGEDVPIMCRADAHGNVSDLFVKKADAIFGDNSTPHIDGYVRGKECIETLIKTVNGEIHPVMVMKRPGEHVGWRMMTPLGYALSGYPTVPEDSPLQKIWKMARKLEEEEDIIKVNHFVGWDTADVENVGASVSVVTNNNLELAEKMAEDVAKFFWSLREEFIKPMVLPKEAVKTAMESEGPVVLHDPEDCPGGAAPGDGTEIFRTLIEMRATNAALNLCDAEAVSKAIQAGVGNTISMKVGGKLSWREDGLHAKPVQITGKVKLISDGVWFKKGPVSAGRREENGRTVVIDINGIEAVVSEKRADAIDPQFFRSVGIEPMDKQILVIKSIHHFRATYEPIVKKIITVHCPDDYSPCGCFGYGTRFGRIWPYKNVPRPIWPLDEYKG